MMKPVGKPTGLINIIAVMPVIAVMAITLFNCTSYIYKLQGISFFESGWYYFTDVVSRPSGLLMYIGRFLTQFCYYPVVGILLYLSVVSGLIYICCGRNNSLSVISGILAVACVFLYQMRMGYGIFDTRYDAQVFTQPLGLLVSVAVYCLCESIENGRYFKIAVVAIAGFHLFGFYTLLGVVMFAMSMSFRKKPLLAIWAAFVSVTIPPALYVFFYRHSDVSYIWLEGTPYLDYLKNPRQSYPIFAAWFCIATFPLSSMLKLVGKKRVFLIASLSLACSYPCYYCVNRDALFHYTLSAEKAIEDNNWYEAYYYSSSFDQSTKALIAYRNIALFHRNDLVNGCRKLFYFNPMQYGEETLSSSRVAGPMIYYHSGLINYSRRWCMDSNLFSTPGMERMKLMAKIAILQKEWSLAEEYLNAIQKSTLQKKWAKEYHKYIDNPSSVYDNYEFSKILALQAYDLPEQTPSEEACLDIILLYLKATPNSPEVQQWHDAAQIMSKQW